MGGDPVVSVIPARALVEWKSLAGALEDVVPPCSVDSESWFPEPEDAVDLQVRLCGRCPAIVECLAFAVAGKETSGVWGGRRFGRGA